MSQTIDQLKKEIANLDEFTGAYPGRRSRLLADLQEAQHRLDQAEIAAMRTGDESGTSAEREAVDKAQQKVMDLDRRYQLARQETSRIGTELAAARDNLETARYEEAEKAAKQVFDKLNKNYRVRDSLREAFATFAAVSESAQPDWGLILVQAFPEPEPGELDELVEKKRAEIDGAIA